MLIEKPWRNGSRSNGHGMIGYEPPPTESQSIDRTESTPSGESVGDGTVEPALLRQMGTLLQRYAVRVSAWVKAAFVPRPPSLVIFTSLAMAVTVFLALVIGLTSAQITGDASAALGVSLLILASLPIALVATISLSVIIPYKAFASSPMFIGVLSSYVPYALGALTGIWAALWLGKLLPFEYDSLAGLWRWTIAIGGPCTWLFVGLVTNQLAATVERRREYEKGIEGLRESRHRIMVVHEATRKEIAGLLHGRVQSRLVVLGHWLKECQEGFKDGPKEAVERLENVNKLLQEIRDQELRSITRQLYPAIIRTGLPSALNSLADRFRSVFSVEVEIDEWVRELESPVRPSLNESLRLTLYRVTEEALSNVAKHSQATEAKVRVSLSESKDVLLEIHDNGQGFKPAEEAAGHGLLSMEDYIEASGGAIEVKSGVGMGTVIVASVPLSRSTPINLLAYGIEPPQVEAAKLSKSSPKGRPEPIEAGLEILTTP